MALDLLSQDRSPVVKTDNYALASFSDISIPPGQGLMALRHLQTSSFPQVEFVGSFHYGLLTWAFLIYISIVFITSLRACLIVFYCISLKDLFITSLKVSVIIIRLDLRSFFCNSGVFGYSGLAVGGELGHAIQPWLLLCSYTGL